MAKVKRNGPCPCGSGKKAKRCCHGPVEYLDVRIMPLEVYRDSVCELGGTTRAEFDDLFGELVDLPEVDLSLQVPLPNVWTPAIDRAVSVLIRTTKTDSTRHSPTWCRGSIRCGSASCSPAPSSSFEMPGRSRRSSPPSP